MKQVFTPITLTCSLQADSVFSTGKFLHGMLTQTANGFRFEEAAKETRKPHTRNPKIFDGTHISLVRKEDNSIQFSFKSTSRNINHKAFAHDVYNEVLHALDMLE